MLKQLYNEVTVALTLEPDGPILIKASESGADPTRPDMEFVRTLYQGREVIYLPGSSLKGVLRAHSERLARTMQPAELATDLSNRRLSCDPLDRNSSCGEQWVRLKRNNTVRTDNIYSQSCFVCRLFGNTSLASRVRVTDAYPNDPDALKTEERNGVAIDRVFGSVAVGPFNYEVATAGAFTCRLLVRNFTIAQLGLIGLTLRDLEMQRVGVGFAKSRGLGRVKATIKEVTVRYPACAIDGKLTLPGSNRPGTEAHVLAGAGTFAPGDGYGLDGNDTATLPAGVMLTADDWGDPSLTLTETAQIKALWRECVKAWKRTVEKTVSG